MYLSTFQVLYKLYLSTHVLKYKVLLPGSAVEYNSVQSSTTQYRQELSTVEYNSVQPRTAEYSRLEPTRVELAQQTRSVQPTVAMVDSRT